MRKSFGVIGFVAYELFVASALAVFCLLAAVPVEAAVWIPVPWVPGSTETDVSGINDNNEIVGSYIDSNGIHGFFGTLSGDYTLFDYDQVNNPGTTLRGISNDGHMTGYVNSDCGRPQCFVEFERNPDGSVVFVQNHGTVFNGIVTGMNSRGEFAGDYFDSEDGTFHGFIGKAGKYKQDIILPFANAGGHARGISDSGIVVGFFVDTTRKHYAHGFIQSSGATNRIDFPDPSEVDTYLSGMSARGLAVGAWSKKNPLISYGFEYDSDLGTFTSIDPPHAKFTQVLGANNAGLLAVDSDAGQFIYCPLKTSKCPNGGLEVPAPKSIYRQFGIDKGVTR